jgi:hypothetical protein
LCRKGTPFQWSHLGVDRTSSKISFADAPSARDESTRFPIFSNHRSALAPSISIITLSYLLTLHILSHHLQTLFPHSYLIITPFCQFTFSFSSPCQPCPNHLLLKLNPWRKPYPPTGPHRVFS